MAMVREVALDTFTLQDVTCLEGVYTFPKGRGMLTLPMENGTLDGISLTEGHWIALDVTCLDARSAAIEWQWRTADGRFSGVKMGILAGIKTRIALPLSVTQGKNLFLGRTPGKLKSVTQGVSIDFRDAVEFRITSAASLTDVHFRIDACQIYDAMPDFPVETKALVDEMGQKTICDWPGKTKSVAEMQARMQAELASPAPIPEEGGRSKWGGDLSRRLTEGTGWFALVQADGRYYLADPDGYAFFSAGLDCVGIDGDCNLEGIHCLAGDLPKESAGWVRPSDPNYFSWHRHNLWTTFGEGYYDKWQELTARRMVKWGFNTVACWSDIPFAVKYDIPHVTIMHGYPKTETYIFRDFPDTLSPAFAENAGEWAKQILRHKDSHALIGYFLGNEPQWAFVNDLNIAAKTLECENTSHCRRALIAFMQEKYGSIDALNQAWGADYASFQDMDRPVSTLPFTGEAMEVLNEFSAIMIREYIRIPSEAIRQYDPHHLNLGIRYAWLSSKVLASGSEYTDVFSFNCYSMDPTDAIESFSKLVGKPVMIGEFHFGALDRGLDATGIRGVTTQAERGVAYRYYLHKAASHPMCLGAHYFTLNDQAYLGRFDGENYQIGIIDTTQRPYEDFEAAIIETHREIYDVMSGKLAPTERKAEEIPAIFF